MTYRRDSRNPPISPSPARLAVGRISSTDALDGCWASGTPVDCLSGAVLRAVLAVACRNLPSFERFPPERNSGSRINPQAFEDEWGRRARSILFHASGGFAAQVRKIDVEPGAGRVAGPEGCRPEIAARAAAAPGRGHEPTTARRGMERPPHDVSLIPSAGRWRDHVRVSPKVYVASSYDAT